MVVLAIGEDEAGLAADGEVVFLAKDFLEGDDVRLRGGGGDAAADFGEALVAELGDVLEAPAVEGDDVDVGGELVHFWGEGREKAEREGERERVYGDIRVIREGGRVDERREMGNKVGEAARRI